MTATSTATETYTRADVYKVFEKFRSDYRMAARSTKLVTEESAESTAEDVSEYAVAGFIKAVHIVLQKADGTVLRAEVYRVTEDASGLTAARPSGCIWDPVPGGSLRIIIELNKPWFAQSEIQKESFMKRLHGSWGPSSQDTTYPGLMQVANRDYVSNAYGLRRSSLSGSGA